MSWWAGREACRPAAAPWRCPAWMYVGRPAAIQFCRSFSVANSGLTDRLAEHAVRPQPHLADGGRPDADRHPVRQRGVGHLHALRLHVEVLAGGEHRCGLRASRGCGRVEHVGSSRVRAIDAAEEDEGADRGRRQDSRGSAHPATRRVPRALAHRLRRTRRLDPRSQRAPRPVDRGATWAARWRARDASRTQGHP